MNQPPNGARRLSPTERKEQLLTVAVELAETHGYRTITSQQIADAAGLASHGLIAHYFGTVDNLRREVMKRAIKTQNTEIVLQGLVVKDLAALLAPQELKTRALLKLASE